MSLSLKVRCTSCNQRFQDAPGVCPSCKSADRWEPCIVESEPVDVDRLYMHPSGVAFFAYDEAAKAGAETPEWAAAASPAGGAAEKRQNLEMSLPEAIEGNKAFLAVELPSVEELAAQIGALTRQWNAFLGLRYGQLDAV